MNLALDRFSRSLYRESLHHMNTCRDCGQVIPEGRKYCPECAHLNWSEEIAGLKLSEFSKRLADVFDGEERDFDILDGLVEFTYYSRNQERLELARRMLDAYGASCSVGTESITFQLKIRNHGMWSEMDIA